jgi:valyl-tRNA synthetase
MVMGRDILFFWSARMIMMSLYRTGKIPFEKLFFTGLVRDKFGKKMSKSRGNGIDPLAMIKKYGADALRLSLIFDTTPGLDFRLYEEKIESFRNFTNKLWNISRYILMNVSEENIKTAEKIDFDALNQESRWILQRLNETISEVNKNFKNYNFSLAGETLKNFTWNEFADWYLEFSKVEKNDDVEKVLAYILKNILKLWHPFMPFVTEHIWSNISKEKLLMVEKWPEELKISMGFKNDFDTAEINVEKIIEIITKIRNLKSDYNIPINKKIDIVMLSDKEWLSYFDRHIVKLAGTNTPQYVPEKSAKPAGSAISLVSSIGAICLKLEGIIDIKKEAARLEKELANLQKFIAGLEKRLKDKNFTAKAPENIINQQKESLEKSRIKIAAIKKQLEDLK